MFLNRNQSRGAAVTALSLLCLLALQAAILSAASAQKPTLDICYVAPDGRDSGSGTVSAPFKTVGRALQFTRERVARLSANSVSTAPKSVEIRLRGGNYPLTQPLSLSTEDSGTGTVRLLITAAPGEKTPPVLSGGVRITGWKNAGGNRWQVTLPEVAQGTWYFSQLYVNGERRVRPRLPKQGYYDIANEAEPSPKAAGKGFDRFRYKQGDIDPNWSNRRDIEVLPFHIWTMSRFNIADIDPVQRTLTVNGIRRGSFSWSRFGAGNRYLIENVREALTEPGEWYLERSTGVLTYLAKRGENPNRDTVIAPRVEQLVKISGAHNLTFRGITFAYAAWNLGPQGSSSAQADIGVPAAISLTDCRDISFDHCTVRDIGNYGVEFGAGTQNCVLEHCILRDLGAGGVKIGTTGFVAEDAKRTENNTVQNCVIAEGGRIHPAGVGVWIGQSPKNKILHNRITDFYYSAISVGWTWGYAQSGAHHNTIAYNDISHIGQGVLSDMSGIYTLGVSPGTVLDHNRMHDIQSFDYGGWGIYFDEGSTGIVATNNLVYNCKSAPFHQHYGTNNLLENNILAMGGQAALMRTRADNNSHPPPDKSKELSFTIRRNIVYGNRDAPIFGSNWTGSNFALEDNLYWKATPNGSASITFPGGAILAAWQKASGKDAKSVIADPLFAAPRKGDFTLPPSSPAVRQIDFVPLNLREVGPRGMTGEADALTAPRAFPPPPPPLPPQPVADNWETFSPGERPASPQMVLSEDPRVPVANLRITDETAASGKRSLKVTDAPGQQHSYTPHLYYKPNMGAGTLTAAFALRPGKGMVFYNEWRDNATPYTVGPSLKVGPDGTLTAGGKIITTLPLEKWCRIEISCKVGPEGKGVYDLTVHLPDSPAPLRFVNLPCESGTKFQQLRWWGFVADGNAPAVFYLDDFSLTKKAP